MKKTTANNLAIISFYALAAVPIAVWLFIAPLGGRFVSLVSAFRSLGQGAGLVGMALLSVNFMLSARFRFLDRWFRGLNRVYTNHHRVGVIAFSLILLHPAFLMLQYLIISPRSAFDFLFSFDDFYIILGELAILAFMLLMVITLYLSFKYQNWKNTHKFLGLVLFLGTWHMLLVPSDVSRSGFLRFYMVLLAVLGGASYLSRTILGLYKAREYRYKLEEVKKINDDTVELSLVPLGRKMSYLPGQFVFIRFDGASNTSLKESHPFSIASASDGVGRISLGIKALGDYTSMINLLEPGLTCRLEGPFGVFSYQNAIYKKQIWVAGGIGITPFLGMARSLASSGSQYNIDLYYSVKSEAKAPFMAELSRISNQIPALRLRPYFSEKEGRISASLISKESVSLKGREIFLCGPPPFMESLRRQFVELGVDDSVIHSEEFNL